LSTDPNSVYQSFLRPENTLAKALHLMGIENFSTNLLEAALRNIEQALALEPNDPQFLYNYALVLKNLKRHQLALEAINKSIALDSQSANGHSLRGNILQELKGFVAAIECYDQAIALQADLADAYNNRAFAYKELKAFSKAICDFEKVLALDPNYPLALGNLIHIKMLNCDWAGTDKLLNRLYAEIEDGKRVANPFSFLALTDSLSLQIKAAQIFGQNHPENDALGPLQPNKAKGPGEKIRIGYFSADFHNHATMYLMAETLELHDKQHFEIHLFSFGPNFQDEMRNRALKAADHFHDVRELSDQSIAQLARDHNIDIAIDLKGYTQDGRQGIFAFRAAPIQMSYLGFPGTLSCEYMDYLIADEVLIPQLNTASYTEKVLYLPHSYQANDRQRPIPPTPPNRASLNLSEHGFVFCSFNNNYKITPEVFATWMQILKKVPGSVLWLPEDSQETTQNLCSASKSNGIDPDRLVFAKRAPHLEHLCRQQAADLFLDTFPFNAHTTASDALWVGLPILTRTGESFASRVAASLLSAVNLPELICSTEKEYVEKAVALAQHPDKLQAMQSHLREKRISLPLFDAPQLTRDLEKLYSQVYLAHQA
jgi:predicted O-linked N-acetylglucosamine transferase (SPINDLY family)